mgnify:CR=1 FL=1
MNKNIFVLSIAIAIIIFLRCIFDGNDNIINIVAIIFVVYTIIEKLLNNIIDKIKKSKVPEQIINREITSAQVKIWGWSIAIGVIVILVYFWKWCSGLGNDIISILALGISILDDEIVKEITDNYKI